MTEMEAARVRLLASPTQKMTMLISCRRLQVAVQQSADAEHVRLQGQAGDKLLLSTPALEQDVFKDEVNLGRTLPGSRHVILEPQINEAPARKRRTMYVRLSGMPMETLA